MKDINGRNKFCNPSTTRQLSGGSRFEENDTLFARITPCLENGKIARVKGLIDKVGFGSTEFLVFRGKNNISDNDFIYYLVRSEEVRSFAESHMEGTSGRQMVSKDCFSELTIDLPPLPDQKAIASVLSSLDDKIDLLHRQNKTLEAMAEAIFKQWFIYFDLIDGIRVVNLTSVTVDTVSNCLLGGTPSRDRVEYWNGTIPWINSSKINDMRVIEPSEMITELGLNNSATKLLPPKTILIAITGATLGQISILEFESCANQSVVGIIPEQNILNEYLYLYLKLNMEDLISAQTGGAQQHINKANIEKFKLFIPNNIILQKFNFLVSPLFDKISFNSFHILNLCKIRNIILPKLLSREITIK
jgi:type I restriction enzyme S subunit